MRLGKLSSTIVFGLLVTAVFVFGASRQARIVRAFDQDGGNWLEAYRSEGATVRYVAKSGANSGSCASPGSPCATIQYAVDKANAGDEIRISAGIYDDVNNIGGRAQVVRIDKSLILIGGFTTSNWTVSDPLANPTIIDAKFSGRVLYIIGADSIVVTGLQIINGDFEDPFEDERGGGIHVETSNIVISSTVVYNNHAEFAGGGISLYQTSALIFNNSITDNGATMGAGGNSGGGIHASQSDLIATDNLISGNYGGGVKCVVSTCSFYSNTISDNVAGEGAGLHLTEVDQPIIVGNLFEGNRASDFGGGVHLDDCENALIESNTFFDNWAFTSNSPFADDEGDGGAIYIDPTSSALIRLNTIAQNKSANGGGIHMYSWNGDSVITENDIYSNTASDGGGGGINVYSNVQISNNNVYGNVADNGGGIYLDGTGCDVNNNYVYANHAIFKGGGILDTSINNIDSNVIQNNLAWFGGGAYISGGTSASSLWTNNIIAQNQATEKGSGIFIYETSPQFIHNTIAANSNGDGSGIYFQGDFSSSPIVIMTNTVIVSQTVGVFVEPEAGQQELHLEATLWGAGGWENGLDWQGGITVMTGTINFWGNPLFVDPLAGDFHISSGSPAFDAGLATSIVTDVDGDFRPFWEGVDIGADELLDFSLFEFRTFLPVILREQ